MKLTINGETRTVDGPMTVHGLLDHLDLPVAKIAVERNLEIVPRSLFAETDLADGDRLEIVHFIGGG
ncbi:MAG: sulfur carrier protein ThiS [Alphaproteobacteria bacterium]